jgi:menaquinone-specific isochorismate synthase
MLAPRNNSLSSDIRTQLAARLDRLDLETGSALVRIELDTPLQPWTWLRQQTHSRRLYWRNRSGDLEISGIGMAHGVDPSQGLGLAPALDIVRQQLDKSMGDVNYYGGMAFDPMRPLAECWQSLSPFYFFVPRLELRCQQGRTTCALNLKMPEDQSVLSDLVAQAEASFSQTGQDMGESGEAIPLGPIVSRQITPDRQQWSGQVTSLLRELGKTQAKLVLACHERICFQDAVDAMEVLGRIRSDRTDSYGFLFTFGQTAFMGMSPEQLYERQGQSLCSEALAGTGQTGADLQASVKENVEHDYVVRDVKEALESIGLDIDAIPAKEIVLWNRLCHLRTQITGRLPETVGDLDILRALHPSAAVLGYPRAQARSWLERYESLQRGWYAGPVGRIGRDAAEFAVAIRSALVHGKILEIYAGAGIVRGSDPDLEWDEIRSKMRQFHEALDLRS